MIVRRSYTRIVDARILVVEDDLTVAEVVVDYLRHAGLEPRHAVDGLIALEMAATWPPDMVILDLMLPGVSGLEGGADDYVTKPFSPRELTLRVQAVLRRARAAGAAAATPQPVRSGRLEVDVAARRARSDGEDLDLTVR